MHKTLIGLPLVAFLGLAIPVHAQEHGGGRQEDRNAQGAHARSARGPQHDAVQGAGPHRVGPQRAGPQRAAPVRQDEYAYGARSPEWRRGGRIPPTYRQRQYVVDDWQGHHLRRPPRGYQWVQVGGDYVLVAIATGIIAELLLNQ